MITLYILFVTAPIILSVHDEVELSGKQTSTYFLVLFIFICDERTTYRGTDLGMHSHYSCLLHISLVCALSITILRILFLLSHELYLSFPFGAISGRTKQGLAGFGTYVRYVRHVIPVWAVKTEKRKRMIQILAQLPRQVLYLFIHSYPQVPTYICLLTGRG